MYEFPCPHCSIPLRLRDESYRQRIIPCPECGQKVLIEESAQGLTGVAVNDELPRTPAVSIPQAKPHLVRWLPIGVAAVLGVAIIVYTLSGPRTPPPAEVSPETPQNVEVSSPEGEPVTPPDPASTPEPVAESQNPVEEQLRTIYGMMAQEIQKAGTFPLGEVPEEKTARSWISRLAESHLPDVSTHWERGWNAPINDEFVRRRFPAFDNPLISQKVGEDRYPASHYVGISGVGADADQLPKTHPRAGIFGTNRSTKQSDVTDGLSNTMLVAGVSEHLGSWARPGKATVRALTAEPYVNGPDGFSTGQPDQMFVLMADGSVRAVSAKADPVIVRRMAAMADGLPLDAQVAGDPLTLKAPREETMPHPPAVGQGGLADQERPILVEVTPEPAFDLRPRLELKLVRYEQSEPVPLEDILFELQELIGAPLDTSRLAPEARRRPVSIRLENTTLAEILKQVSDAARVSYEIRPDVILFSSDIPLRE